MNEVKITLIGGPTALVEVGGFRLLVNPVLDRNGEFAQQHFEKIGNVDALLLSHDRQAENVARASRAMLARAAWVVTTVAGARLLGEGAEGLAPWESRELYKPDGSVIRITATPAREGRAGIEPFAVDAIAFIISSPHEFFRPVYITGEATWYDGVTEVPQRFQLCLALLLGSEAQTQPRSHATSGIKANQTALKTREGIRHFNSWGYLQRFAQYIGRRCKPRCSLGAEIRKLAPA